MKKNLISIGTIISIWIAYLFYAEREKKAQTTSHNVETYKEDTGPTPQSKETYFAHKKESQASPTSENQATGTFDTMVNAPVRSGLSTQEILKSPGPNKMETSSSQVIESINLSTIIPILDEVKLKNVNHDFPTFQPLSLDRHQHLVEDIFGRYEGRSVYSSARWSNSRFEFELEKIEDQGKASFRAVFVIFRDGIRISRMEGISGDENKSLRFDPDTQTLVMENGDGSYLQMILRGENIQLIGNFYENNTLVSRIIFEKKE